MTTAAVKLTQKGQVTIPKEIREKLKSNTVYFSRGQYCYGKTRTGRSRLLSEYAGNVKPGASMKQMKDKAWEVAVREKTSRKSS